MSDFPSRIAQLPQFPNPAEIVKDHLVKHAARFRRGCELDGESAVFYATDGDAKIDVASMSHVGQHLILFVGNDAEGRHVELLQHHTLVSFQMVAVKDEGEVVTTRRIGFNDEYLGEKAEGLVDL